MAGKKEVKEITPDDVKAKDITKAIKEHFKTKDTIDIIRDISKLITIILVLSIVAYGVLYVFAVSSIEDKGFFKWAPDKKFYAFSTCKLDKKVNCIYHINQGTMKTIVLQNNYAFPIKIYNARLKNCRLEKNVSVKETMKFNLSLNCSEFKHGSSEIVIDYINTESTLPHKTMGKVSNYFEITPMFKVLYDIAIFYEVNANFVVSSMEEIDKE